MAIRQGRGGLASFISFFGLILGSPAVSAQVTQNAQLGITGSLGSGGSCGFGFQNSSSSISGGFQGTISSMDPVVSALPSSGCGSCISVQCNALGNQAACKMGAAPLILAIVDSCPSCQLTAPQQGFNQIADTFLGNLNVNYQQVPCPAMGNLVARIDNYRASGGGYLRLIIINAASSGAFQSLQIRSNQGGAWLPCVNTFGGTWEISELPNFPLDLQLQNSYGQQMTILNALPVSPSGDVDLGVNFPVLDASQAAQTPEQAAQGPSGAPQVTVTPVHERPFGTRRSIARPHSILRRKLQQLVYYIPTEGTISLTDLINELYPGAVVVAPPPPGLPMPTPGVPATPLNALPPATISVIPYPPPPAPIPVQPAPPEARVQAAAPAETPEATAPAQIPVPVSPSPPTPSSPTPAPTSVPTAAALSPTIPSGPLQLANLPPAGQPCEKINDFLNSSASLQTWNKLLQNSGYTNNLAQPNVSITMFAPINSAFTAPVLANTQYGSTVNAADISSLAASNPAAVNPIIGYHFIYGVTPSLNVGTTYNTTDTLKTFGADDRYAQISIPAADQIQAIGNRANVLQSSLQVCGPSVVYVIDAVLLPIPLNSSSAPSTATTGR